MVGLAYAAPMNANSVGSALSPIIVNIINPVIWLLFAAAVVLFVFGVIRFIISGDASDKARDQAKWAVFGGLIGMFIMMSAWGIVHFVANTVNSL